MRSETTHTFLTLFCFFPLSFPGWAQIPAHFLIWNAGALPVRAGVARLLSSDYMFSKKPQMLSWQSKLQENPLLPKLLWNKQGSQPHWLPHVSWGTPKAEHGHQGWCLVQEEQGVSCTNAGAEISTTTWAEHIYWWLSCPPRPPGNTACRRPHNMNCS